MTWRCLHVYHHANPDQLITGAVGPLLRQLRPRVPMAYFLRHWRRGPHVRLVFDASDADFKQLIRPAAEDHVGGYLRRCPSTAVLDAGRELALHQVLADREQDPGPLLPWPPDNTIGEEPHERRAEVLGSEQAADWLAAFYRDTNEPALGALAQVRAGAQRSRFAFHLLVATACRFGPGGPGNGVLSYRSLAERVRHDSPAPSGLGARWQRHSAANLASLAAEVRAVFAAANGAPCLEHVRTWLDALAAADARAAPLLASGALVMPSAAGWLAAFQRGERDPELAALSDFHRALARSPVFRTEVAPSAGFARYRLLVNATYLHLSRLGVTPDERALLCHLAADAVEAVTGVSTAARVGLPVPAGQGGGEAR